MPAVSFTEEVRGGEQKLASVGTTWQEVRMPTRCRRVTVTFDSDGYLGRGQTHGAVVTGHRPIASGSPYELRLGTCDAGELAQGYRSIFVAVATGTADVYVRSEIA